MSLSDTEIEDRVNALRRSLEAWLDRFDLREGAYIKSYEEHVDDEPDSCPALLLLCFDNDLYSLFDGNEYYAEALEALESLLSTEGLCWERFDGSTVQFVPLSDEDSYFNYFRFRWLCGLIKPDLIDATSEVFGYFRSKPLRLAALEPRALEVLIDAAFRNQGFRTELGPGTADGGVDIRLYQHDAIGELQTLVQVKRYADHRPIRLDAVAALRAIVDDEKANRGLFVTTSRYLTGVKRFAARQGHVIRLADTGDMVEWCRLAEASIATTAGDDWIAKLLEEVRSGQSTRSGLVGKIVHARWGYNMTINDFCVVLRDTPSAALLASLEERNTQDDHGQIGEQVPEYVLRSDGGRPNIFFGRKKAKGQISIWGQRRLYHLWDGQPKFFNYMD